MVLTSYKWYEHHWLCCWQIILRLLHLLVDSTAKKDRNADLLAIRSIVHCKETARFSKSHLAIDIQKSVLQLTIASTAGDVCVMHCSYSLSGISNLLEWSRMNWELSLLHATIYVQYLASALNIPLEKCHLPSSLSHAFNACTNHTCKAQLQHKQVSRQEDNFGKRSSQEYSIRLGT